MNEAAAKAVQVWLQADQGPEADAALLLALDKASVVNVLFNPWVENQSREFGHLVHVFHSNGVVQVNDDGTIHHF